MIRNRLSELLSERGLKITKVAKDTGISRNTLTATAQNDSRMIQYETIDTLCSYLGISPNDFFQYIPYSVSYSVQITELTFSPEGVGFPGNAELDCSFDLFIDFSSSRDNREFQLQGKVLSLNKTGVNHYHVVVELTPESDTSDKELEAFRSASIPVGFYSMIEEEMQNAILNSIKEELAVLLDSIIEHEVKGAHISPHEAFREFHLKNMTIDLCGKSILLIPF